MLWRLSLCSASRRSAPLLLLGLLCFARLWCDCVVIVRHCSHTQLQYLNDSNLQLCCDHQLQESFANA